MPRAKPLGSKHKHSYIPQICIVVEAVLVNTPRVFSIGYTKLAPGYVLTEVNFEPTQEMEPR